MNTEIREMRPEDADSKGYVHWKTWQETYTGLMEEKYLANQRTLRFPLRRNISGNLRGHRTSNDLP